MVCYMPKSGFADVGKILGAVYKGLNQSASTAQKISSMTNQLSCSLIFASSCRAFTVIYLSLPLLPIALGNLSTRQRLRCLTGSRDRERSSKQWCRKRYGKIGCRLSKRKKKKRMISRG